jgi:hypothetical protein
MAAPFLMPLVFSFPGYEKQCLGQPGKRHLDPGVIWIKSTDDNDDDNNDNNDDDDDDTILQSFLIWGLNPIAKV